VDLVVGRPVELHEEAPVEVARPELVVRVALADRAAERHAQVAALPRLLRRSKLEITSI
jgi:hypothetical protein